MRKTNHMRKTGRMQKTGTCHTADGSGRCIPRQATLCAKNAPGSAGHSSPPANVAAPAAARCIGKSRDGYDSAAKLALCNAI